MPLCPSVSLPRPRRPRAGLSALVVVGGLLVVLGAIAWFQMRLTSQSLSAVQRSHLAALARIQGRSAIEELLDQVAAEANLPGTPLFQALRQSPSEPWSRIDLKPLLRRPSIDIRPSWGRDGAEAVRDLEAELLDFLVLLRSPVASTAPGATAEYVAVLTLTATVEARGNAGKVRRGVSATHELRLVRTAPPAPVGYEEVLIEGVQAVFDPAAVNAIRQRALTAHEAFRQELLAEGAARPGDLGTRLTALGNAMSVPAEAAKSSVPFPTDAGTVLIGAEHSVAGVPGSFLDLVTHLQDLETKAQERIDEFRGLLASDPDQARKVAFKASHDAARPLTRLWTFQRGFDTLAPDSPRRATRLGNSLEALVPQYFLDRVHLRMGREEPLFQRWSAGEARVDGVVELEASGTPVELARPTWGRTVLVVRGGGQVVLKNAAPDSLPDPTEALFHAHEDEANRGDARLDSLVVVSLGADVAVEGDSQAAVLMLAGVDGGPPGSFRLASGARLRGSVVIRDGNSDRVEIRGTVLEDPALQAPMDPSAGLDGEGPTHYTVAISPAPVFLSPL